MLSAIITGITALIASVSVTYMEGPIKTHATVTGHTVVMSDSTGWRLVRRDTFGHYDQTTNTRTLIGHSGGWLALARVLIERANQRGEHVRLICTNGCISSATMWLGADNVCIGRNGWFGFHGPTVDIWGLTPAPWASEAMAEMYPPSIAAMFRAKWRDRWGMSFYTVTAKQLKAIEPSLKYCG